MTSNRNKGSDRMTTERVLAQFAASQPIPNDSRNWLDHTKRTAQIDRCLVRGATMEELRKHRGGIKDHFWHLEHEHGLKVVESGGVYRLTVPPA